MKNTILFITFLSFFGSSFVSVLPKSKVNVIVQKVKEKDKKDDRSKVVKVFSGIANGTACVAKGSAATVKYLFSCVDRSLDYMLSFKGAIKTAVIITPIIILYCKYKGFTLESSMEILNHYFDKCLRFVASVEERYLIQKEIGRAQAQLNNIIEQPKQAFLVRAKDYVSKTWNFVAYKGIPYAASIVFQSWMISKKYIWKN